jgi:RND family efflux transporter MFP subunit
MKRFLFLATLIFAAPAWAGSEAPSERVEDVARPVITQLVGVDALQKIAYIGTVAAGNEVALGFPFSGTLVERSTDLGALVSKGDILARLDPKDLQAEVRSAQARVLVADTNVRTAQEAASRATELLERGVDSTSRSEDAQRALVAARAGLEQAQANLARAQDSLDLSVLIAPQDGVIVGAFLDAGALVASGLEVLRLASTDEREVVVDISEQGLAELKIGMRFDVALVANTRQTTTATLFRIDPVAESATRARRVHFILSDPPQGFRFGALVRIRASADDAVVVSLPLSAVLDADGVATVWLVDRDDNIVKKQPVVLGDIYGDRVRVTSGLDVNDEVVLRGIHSLHEGQAIGRSMSR